MSMTRSRQDYAEEANRFEEWLLLNWNRTMNDIDSVDNLINLVEAWLESIDVFGGQAGAFAKSLIDHLLTRNMIPTVASVPKEVEIIKGFGINRTGTRWLSYESKTLKRLYQLDTVTTGYIARELGRSKRAIYSKARALGVKRPKDALTERDVQNKFDQMSKDDLKRR